MSPLPRARRSPPHPILLLSLSTALILTLTASPVAEAKVARPGRELSRRQPSTTEGPRGPARRPAARRTTPAAWDREPTWEVLEEPSPLPLPPLPRPMKRPAVIVPTNGTVSGGEASAGGVDDGGWSQEGSTSPGHPSTVAAVPLYLIDAPERVSVATGNCGPGERWLNNRCRTAVGQQ